MEQEQIEQATGYIVASLKRSGNATQKFLELAKALALAELGQAAYAACMKEAETRSITPCSVDNKIYQALKSLIQRANRTLKKDFDLVVKIKADKARQRFVFKIEAVQEAPLQKSDFERVADLLAKGSFSLDELKQLDGIIKGLQVAQAA